MEFKSTNLCFSIRKQVLKFIMRTFIFLFCTAVFSFSSGDLLSQNSKIVIDADKTLTIDEVFDMIDKQTDYSFVYQSNMFIGFPSIEIKKGVIRTNKLLQQILSKGDFNIALGVNNTIIIKEKTPDIVKKQIKNQGIKVSGIITDSNNQPLPGANILEKGTTNGAQSDFDGKFSLNVKDGNAILVISYLGFITREVVISNQSQLSIVLKDDSAKLDEVVVVGYGRQKKANLTGAVANIDGDDINQRPITQASQALQGLSPSIFINSNSGEPGNDESDITIRGVGTFNNSAPLILIDGIEAPLNNINPNDIESVSVLKDAASAAIYGTRAANGVVLITTKRGATGKASISYNTSYSITSPTILPDVVTDTRTYLETYVKAAEYRPRSTPFTPELINEIESEVGSNNWLDSYINTGEIINHDLSISGGSENVKYRVSTRYLDQQGYLEGDYFTKRLNTRLNLDMKLRDNLNAGISFAYSNTDNRQAPKNDPNTSFNIFNDSRYTGKGNFLYTILLASAPNSPVYDEFDRYMGTGSESSRSQRDNPQGLIDNQWIDIDSNEIFGNAFIEFEPVENLKIKYVAGVNFTQNALTETRLQYEQYDRFGSLRATRTPGSILKSSTGNTLNVTNWLQVNYIKSFGNHNFNLLAGINQETAKNELVATVETGFGSTSLVRIGNGTAVSDITNDNGEWALQSQFGRLIYDFKNKYLVEMNIRRDGSSRFGSKSRWGTFPGFSAGYVISNEDFWNKSFISKLKLRASWGKLGVQSSSLYPFASQLNLGSDYNGNSGAALTSLGNPELEWEETTSTNFGIDLELLKGKIYIEAEYFNKESANVITSIENPLTVGGGFSIVNAATIENKGWELTLNTNNKIGDLNIKTAFNISNLKNKVLEINPNLSNDDDIRIDDAGRNIYQIRGESVNAIYGHKFGGIFQIDEFNSDGTLVSGVDYSWIGTPRPGDIKYTDQNGDGVIDENDRVVIGNRNPEWLYGFNLNINYRNFDFGLFLQGQGRVNSFVNRYTGNYGHSGLRTFWLDGWTEDNPSTTVPRIFVDRDGFNGRTINGNGNQAQNSFWVIDQSYIRLKNITLGYTLLQSFLNKININSCRLYVSGQNLLTFSKLDDLDPERNQTANHFGGTLPQAKAYTFGMNITF